METFENLCKRENIINAARRIFVKKGFIDTTIEDLAKAAKISKGTFYNYFNSKEEIFVHILNLDVRERREKLDKILILDLSLKKKYRYICMEYLKDCFEAPDMSLYRLKVLFSNNFGDSEEIKALKYNLCYTSTKYFEKLLEMHKNELKESLQSKIKLSARGLSNHLRVFLYTFLTGEEYFGETKLKSRDELRKNVKMFKLNEITYLMEQITIGGFLK
ncbi:TetR/AcrR family transcriptional regulator [uncultured Ilyobacter sp.]|uniref:TetR/AcrR family transcriptional regulator n=1 Tax=uncultured Ilyobacter sp. TaxID=544433 RepID=UPI0029C79965|nr:TetR/AcrR family transcriptional regulator [uncultured Ilyobacter sp.]